jgi:hypothetical protein
MFLMTQDGGSGSSQLWHSTSVLYRQYHFKIAKEEERPLLSHRRVSDLLAELENSGLAVSRTSWQGRHGYGRQYRLMVPPEFFADCFDPQILEEILHRFRKIIYDKIDQPKLLPNEESEVLFELIEHLPDSNYASLIETVDKVSKQVGKSKLDTMRIINKLVERKVVQLGISYPS